MHIKHEIDNIFMTKLYIDTNVYLDYLLGRKDRLRPIGEFAFELLRRAVNCEFEILISDVVLDELRNNTSEEKINRLLQMLKRKLIPVKKDNDAVLQAQKISKTDFWDALHYVIAKREGAEIIVTRNVQHFGFSDLEVKFPENL